MPSVPDGLDTTYRSALDGTLQPYTPRVPESVDRSRRYPMLVFLHPASLAPFRDARLFIFHGTEDLICPYAKAVQMVERLKTAGADGTFVSEQGTGHESPNAGTVGALAARRLPRARRWWAASCATSTRPG